MSEFPVDEPLCTSRYYDSEPCLLLLDHGGTLHRGAKNTWGMHLPYTPDGGYVAAEDPLTITVRSGAGPGPTIGDISQGERIADQYDLDLGVLTRMIRRAAFEAQVYTTLRTEAITPEQLAEQILDSEWFRWASGQIGCCTPCSGLGGISGGGCGECYSTGHCHAKGDPCRTPWVRA